MVFCREFPWNGGVFSIFFYCIILGRWDYSNQHNIGVNIKHLLKSVPTSFTKKKIYQKKEGRLMSAVCSTKQTHPTHHPGWEPRLARQQRHQSLVVVLRGVRAVAALQQLVASLATLLRRLHGDLHGTDDLKNFWSLDWFCWGKS
jgi:hypothetical protein